MVSAKPHLSAAELIEALETLDMEQLELARLLDVGRATSQRWARGGAPGHVSLFIRLLLARPELKELIGAQPRTGRGRPVKPRVLAKATRKKKAA